MWCSVGKLEHVGAEVPRFLFKPFICACDVASKRDDKEFLSPEGLLSSYLEFVIAVLWVKGDADYVVGPDSLHWSKGAHI